MPLNKETIEKQYIRRKFNSKCTLKLNAHISELNNDLSSLNIVNINFDKIKILGKSACLKKKKKIL